MRKHFITFSDSKYNTTKLRIYNEAVNSNFFDTITLYGESDLPDSLLSYCLANERGFGFWSWKPFIVKTHLGKIEFNDILIYCDVGCIINPNGIVRFNEYIELLKKYEMLAFQMHHLEKEYTKMDTLISLKGEHLSDTGQIAATSFLLKKTNNTLDIINNWNEYSNDKHLIDDSESIIQNDSSFKDHRHDQSILSILCKMNNVHLLGNEIWMALDKLGNIFDNNYPLHGARLKY